MSRALAPLAVLLPLCALLCALAPARARTLEELLAPAWKGGSYRPPPPAELAEAVELFAQLLAGPDPAAQAGRWAHLGWDLLPVAAGPDPAPVWVLTEQTGARQGRGAYAFRSGAVWPAALEMPHGLDDADTARIGLCLFQEGRFRAAAWNTVPRGSAEDGESPSDLAHLPESYMNAFTRAWARRFPEGPVLQLHGFAAEKRSGEAARRSQAILSSGTREPGGLLLSFARCLGPALPAAVSVFPRDVDELGALTNTNAAALREEGGRGFLHLELERDLRRRLAAEPALRRSLLGCLEKVLP